MGILLTTVSLLSPVFFAGVPVSSQDADFETRRTELEKELVGLLEGYVSWCEKSRLFHERQRICERILELDPEHVAAHKTLGHRRRRGEWVVPGRGRDARNYDDEAAAEAPDRLALAVAPFTDAVVAWLEQRSLTPEQRRTLEQDVLRFDPNEPRVREMRGEVELTSGWVLAETRRAFLRREEIASIIDRAFESTIPPVRDDPTPGEEAFGIDFSVATGPGLRVLASSGHDEASEMVRVLQAAVAAFNEVFGEDARLPRGCRIFLLASESEKEAFLSAHPSVDDELRRELQMLEGSGIEGTGDWAYWEGDEKKRRDGIVRMAIGWFLRTEMGITSLHGGVCEGIGIYFTKALVGTRLSWFVHPPDGVDPREAFTVRDRLLDPQTNWMREAVELIDENDHFELAPMLQKTSSRLTVEDLLCSHALAAYLVEGFPDETARVLRALGSVEAEGVFTECLGLDPGTVGARLARWIRESRAAELRPPLAAVQLRAGWESLDEESRAKAIEDFCARLRRMDTLQLRILRALVPPGDTSWKELPPEPEPTFYDPKVHAPAQPIRRHWLEPDDPRVRAVHRTFFGEDHPQGPHTCFRYLWDEGFIARTGDPLDPEILFHNASHGLPPFLDLAAAVALRTLDRGDHRALFAAFGHLYTDRQGGVYPGTTLYDAWASETTIEMPDVDVLGIVHEVLEDWDTWQAPIPGTEHPVLYAEIGEMFACIRRYRTFREGLVDHLLMAEPPGSEYTSSRTNLHALWALHDSDPERLAPTLPDQEEQKRWFRQWIESCREDGELHAGGRRRRSQLLLDEEAVQRELEAAMKGVGADLRSE